MTIVCRDIAFRTSLRLHDLLKKPPYLFRTQLETFKRMKELISLAASFRRQDSSEVFSAQDLIDNTDEHRVDYPAPLKALFLETDLLDSASSL